MSHLIHFLIILMLGCLAPELDNFCKYPEMGHLKTSLAPAEEQSASVGLAATLCPSYWLFRRWVSASSVFPSAMALLPIALEQGLSQSVGNL